MLSLQWLVVTLLGIHAKTSPSFHTPPKDEMTSNKSWTKNTIHTLWQERREMNPTPIVRFAYQSQPHVEILFKNETASPSGSVKHRQAWMLMMWALIEGHIVEGTPVVELSSGNTAAALAYFCQKIGLNFTAIVSSTTPEAKQNHIRYYGGKVITDTHGLLEMLARAEKEVERTNGFFMMQAVNSHKAEEFHESGGSEHETVNLFPELLQQLENKVTQSKKIPDYFIHTASTGGTISSIGRYIRKNEINTQLVLADTEFSTYFSFVKCNRKGKISDESNWVPPGMAGTGGKLPLQLGMTTSLVRSVIDRVLQLPDIASTAAMNVLRNQGIAGGPSTGVDFLAALHVAATSSKDTNQTIATVLGDPAGYYEHSYLNRAWINKNFALHGGLMVYDCWVKVIELALIQPIDPLQVGAVLCTPRK